MKKTLLIISLIFGAASSQAFELSKAGTPSILKGGSENRSSCSSQCYYQFNNCQNHGLPAFICNNYLSSCLLDCPSDDGPGPIRDCGGVEC